MNHVLFVFLSLSVSGSILALILFALRPLIKNRLSQTWQYYIWLVVILRFLLPVSPDISLVGQAARYIEDSIPASAAALEPDSDQPDRAPAQVPADSQSSPNSEEAAPLPQTAQPERWRELLSHLWVVWVAGALMLFAYKVVSYHGFSRFVKGRAQKVADDRMLEIYREELSAAKVRKLPLRVSDRVGSPMLIGVFRPMLVIPMMDVGDDVLRHILRHELTHYRRFDYCYKWLVQITKCLHWFNPLIYRISQQVDKCCELSCDEANIRRLDRDGRESYGNALMASLVSQENYSDFVVSMTMSENVKLVKERLDRIVDYKKKSGAAIGASSCITLLLLCGFTFTGAYLTPLHDTGLPTGAAQPIVKATEHTAPTAQPAQVVDSRLTLVEQEYTIAELQALNVSGLIVGTLSENIEVTRGGDTLKISYYQMSSDEYVIHTQPDQGGTVHQLAMRRSTPASPDDPQRTISITVPEHEMMAKVMSLKTDSGSISADHCIAEVMGLATQSGRILLDGGAVSELLTVKTDTGTALISGTILPERGTSIVGTELYTGQGTIMFQPAESAWDYRYNLNTGADAKIYVNGRQYQGGGGNINNYSRSRVSFATDNGSLIVQDFSMGRLSLDDISQPADTSQSADEIATGSRSIYRNDYYSSYHSYEYQRRWQTDDFSERAEHQKDVYEVYEPYGLAYDTATNRLYLNGELVRYFADIWGNPAHGGVYRFFGPYTDGTMIVTAQRSSEGELTGLATETYRSDQYYEWETGVPNIGAEVAEKILPQVREILRNAYAEEYGLFGLRYDVQSGQLYHNNKLVQYFEDQTVGRYFGAYVEGEYMVYAVRDHSGNLTGLQVGKSNRD